MTVKGFTLVYIKINVHLFLSCILSTIQLIQDNNDDII